MARTTRNSFTYAANRKRVTFQLSQPAVDNELNELQDMLSTEAVEVGHAAASALFAAQPNEGPKPVLAFGDAWKPVATGGAVSLTAGTAWIDGYAVNLPADLDLSTAPHSLSFAADPGYLHGIVYADLVLSEVDSTTDPTIATAKVGETTMRNVLSCTFYQVTAVGTGGGLAVYDTLHATIAALPAVTPGRVWTNNTARVVICRYMQQPAVAGVVTADIVDLRQMPPGEAQSAHFYVDLPSFVSWDVTGSRLQISNATARAAGAPGHTLERGQVATVALVGAGNADGVAPSYDGVGGWSIADGEALGWLAVGVAADTTTFSQFRTKGTQDVTDTAVAVADGSLTLNIHKLSVEPLAVFAAKGDVGTRVLCIRRGNDLHWWNGAITRGVAARVVVDNPNRNAAAAELVIAEQENGTMRGVALNGVEAALNHLASALGAGALGTTRSLILRVRRGAWDFTRRLCAYGTAAEVVAAEETYSATSNIIQLEGDGSECTRMRFRNPEGAPRALGSPDLVTMCATRIVLRGITFDSVHDATFPLGRLLFLSGAEVVLEDCVFYGPVRISALRVTVKNCTFHGVANAYTNFAEGATGNPWVAQHLQLEAHPSGGDHTWRVEGCSFRINSDVGTHASVVVSDTLADLVCVIEGCRFRYVANTGIPAVHLAGGWGQVAIRECRFSGARGMEKAGITSAALWADVPEWLAAYTTIPMYSFGSGRIVTHAYVSSTTARFKWSKLSVDACSFTMADVGAGHATPEWIVWGCCLVFVNYSSALGAAAVPVHNISFMRNTCVMALDSASASYLASAVARTNNPALWGFEVAVPYNDSASISNFVLENVHVEGNVFDIGGATGVDSTRAWRSNVCVLPVDNATWAAIPGPTGPLLSMSAHLIGVDVGNRSDNPGGSTFSGRSATGISIVGNRIKQRLQSGASPYVVLGEPLDGLLAYGPSAFVPVYLAASANEAPTTSNSPGMPVQPGLFDVHVAANAVIQSVFAILTARMWTHPRSAHFVAISAYRPNVVGNSFLSMANSAGSDIGCVYTHGTVGANFVGNQFSGWEPITGGAVAVTAYTGGYYAANNWDGSNSAALRPAATLVIMPHAGSYGDNFKLL